MADSIESPTSATPSNGRQLPAAPPLRIHHLLAWMTVTAVLISSCLWFDRTVRYGPPITTSIVIYSLILGTATLGGVLTLVGSGILWRRRGYKFPTCPGEWLLVVLAVSLSAFSAFWLISLVIGDHDRFLGYFVIAAFAIWVWLNAAGCSWYADTVAWRVVYFGLMLWPAVLLLITDDRGNPKMFPLAAVAAGVLFAAWRDVRSRSQRPWTHWVGVGAVVWLCAAMIGLSVG